MTRYQSITDMCANESLHYLLPEVNTQREAVQVYKDLYRNRYTPTATAMALEMEPLTDTNNTPEVTPSSALTPNNNNTPEVTPSSARTHNNTPEVPRAKLGYSHMERMSLRKRNREDMQKFHSERDAPVPRKARRDDSYRTATEASNV